MYYGIISEDDVLDGVKKAAIEALEIAQNRLDIPKDIKIIFFADRRTCENHTKKPDLFFDPVYDFDSQLLAKVESNCIYVHCRQYRCDVKRNVLAACWIMEVANEGNIYRDPLVFNDEYLQMLEEDAFSFAERALKEADGMP